MCREDLTVALFGKQGAILGPLNSHPLLMQNALTCCISFLLLHSKSPQTQQLKTTHIFYLTVNVGRSLGTVGLGFLLRASHDCKQDVSWTVFSSGGLTEEESAPRLIRQRAEFIFFWMYDKILAFCWLSEEASLGSQRAPEVPCFVGFLNMASHFTKPVRRISHSDMLRWSLK